MGLRSFTGALGLDAYDPSKSDALLERLHSLPWLKDVRSDVPGSFVVRGDLGRVDAELCPLLAGLGVPIKRFEHLESTLEDVFVEVIGQ